MRDGVTFAGLAALGVSAWALAWPGLPQDERITYAMAAWMLLAIVTLNILTNIAGGMRNFVLCYMPEGFLRPLVFFVAIALAGILGIGLSASRAMLTFAVITALIACGVALILGRQMPQDAAQPATRPGLAQRWRREAWQLVLLAVFTNFFADVGIVVAACFLDNASTAIFGLCLKLALLVGYFVQIGQQMAVPDMADARHTQDGNRLRRAARRSILLPSAITAISMAVIWLYGTELLSLFGPDFAAGRDALLILLAAQLLRALAGPSAHLLTLSGIQSVNMGIAVSSLAVLCIATATLTPMLGVAGAAYAVLITYGYWIGISAVALRRLGEPPVDIVSLSIA